MAMSEPKPFASLASSLLARKGTARPAMRPQMAPLPRFDDGEHTDEGLEDLGWNDMGEHHDRPHVDILPLTPQPINLEALAETRAEDRAAAEQLARNAQRIAHGEELDEPAAVEKPEVVRQREEASARLELDAPVASIQAKVANGVDAEPSPVVKRAARARKSALAQGRRAAFTLRLDGERHLKLRLACTINNRSAQQIVTEALDRLLGDMPELETLAAQVKRH